MEPIVQEQDATGQWVDVAPDTPIFEKAPPAAAAVADDDDDEGVETPPAAVAKPPVADPKKGKPRSDPEARISQAVARQREAERQRDEAVARAREIETRGTKPAEAKPAVQAKPEKFSDYPTYLNDHPDASLEDWMDARDEWRDTKREAAAKAQTETQRTEEAFATRVSTFGERFSQAATADPELKDRIDKRLLGVRPLSALTAADKQVINSIQDPAERNEVVFRCFLADQWIDSEDAIEILEKLSDPDEFQRLAALPPNRVVWELARSVKGLPAASPSGPAKKTAPFISKVPAPIVPVRSTPHQSDDAEPNDDASDDEWLRWERARAARGRR